jgi:hypothetical protein
MASIPVFHATPEALNKYGQSFLTKLAGNMDEVINTFFALKQTREKQKLEEAKLKGKIDVEKQKAGEREREYKLREKKASDLETYRKEKLKGDTETRKMNQAIQNLRAASSLVSQVRKNEDRSRKRIQEGVTRAFTRTLNQAQVDAKRKGLSKELSDRYVAEKLDAAFSKDPRLAEVAKVKFQSGKPDDSMARLLGLSKVLSASPETKGEWWESGTTTLEKERAIAEEKVKAQLSPKRRKVLEWIIKLPSKPDFQDVFRAVQEADDEEIEEKLEKIGYSEKMIESAKGVFPYGNFR